MASIERSMVKMKTSFMTSGNEGMSDRDLMSENDLVNAHHSI